MRKGALIAVVAVAFLLIASLGFITYSSTPSFCSSCHNMVPFYESWQRSPHKEVACVTCHFEPGLAGTIRGKKEAASLLVRYLTDTYSPKPFARITDKSCLQEGCHVKEKLGKTKAFLGKAAFDHAPHFKTGLQTDLKCTSCHTPLKAGKHISVNEQHCYLCHLRDASTPLPDGSLPDSDCAPCHTPLPAPIERAGRTVVHTEMKERQVGCRECHTHVVRGEGRVPETKCYNCHDFAEKAATRKEIDTVHAIHVPESVECFLCHDTIVHQAVPLEKEGGDDCRACHMKKHSATALLYAGKGGIGAPDHPSVMRHAGVDCAGCHIGDDKGAVRRSCVNCHNAERYGAILDKWLQVIDQRQKSARRLLDQAAKVVGDDPGKVNLLEDARYDLALVVRGKGVHNMGYALALLDLVERNCRIILGEPALDSPADKTKKTIFWFEETEGLDPVRFDHRAHRKVIRGCKTCHDRLFPMERGGSDALGSLTMGAIYRGKFCGDCHDGNTAPDAAADCGYCHTPKEAVGKVAEKPGS